MMNYGYHGQFLVVPQMHPLLVMVVGLVPKKSTQSYRISFYLSSCLEDGLITDSTEMIFQIALCQIISAHIIS
jgi:hypothetical protein